MESPDLQAEKTLATAIDRLREQFPQTQDLYREVCVLMFFRYGMTPTANKLYQLVRKGSMSAPAEALNRFWENLREKSRVVIAHPDLPDALKTAAGELTATLWQAAQAAAHESAAAYRLEAQTLVEEAKTAMSNVLQEQEYAQRSLDKSQEQLAVAVQQNATLKEQMAGLTATHAALQAQLTAVKEEGAAQLDAAKKRADKTRQEYLAQQRKFEDATELAEQRFRALETRALMEVDRERTTANKLQKTLELERHGSSITTDRHRTELNAAQQASAELRLTLGLLQGQAHTLTSERDQANKQVLTVQRELQASAAALAGARTEIIQLRSAPLRPLSVRRSAVKKIKLGKADAKPA
jgi:chromosome segregation ATPase